MNPGAWVGGVLAAGFMFVLVKYVPQHVVHHMPSIDRLYGNLLIITILIGGGLLFDYYYGENFQEENHD